MKKTYAVTGHTRSIKLITYESWIQAFGSLEAAHFVFMMSNWHHKGRRSDGFIYKSREDIEKETCLKRKKQQSVVDHLIKLGVLETRLMHANGHPTLHYRLIADVAQKLVDIEEEKLNLM